MKRSMKNNNVKHMLMTVAVVFVVLLSMTLNSCSGFRVIENGIEEILGDGFDFGIKLPDYNVNGNGERHDGAILDGLKIDGGLANRPKRYPNPFLRRPAALQLQRRYSPGGKHAFVPSICCKTAERLKNLRPCVSHTRVESNRFCQTVIRPYIRKTLGNTFCIACGSFFV